MSHHHPHPADEALGAELCARIEGVIAVYRFGSSVDGRMHPESDLDVAVLAGILERVRTEGTVYGR